MSLTRSEKEGVVKDTTALIKASNGVIFADSTGVGVESLRVLRRKLKEAGANYQATKRTLTRIALREAGYDAGEKLSKTSLGLIFVPTDIPAVAKLLHEYAKKEKNFKILNALDGEKKEWLEPAMVLALAKLPSRQDLLTQLAYVLISPVKRLAYTVDQIAKQKVVS